VDVTLSWMMMTSKKNCPNFFLQTASLSLANVLQQHSLSHLWRGTWASRQA
jgi:hypothetical protein